MSNSSTSSPLAFVSEQIVIYLGFFIFIAGFIGEILTIMVFLSLHTFRQSSCAFYLTVMSIVNTFHLFTGLLTFIMSNGFSINWTDMSLFYCKFRPFYVQLSVLMSFTCMCLATIDQFFATCSRPRWHKLNNIKLARYIVIIAILIWILHGIPFILYYNRILSPITNQFDCVVTNVIFQVYYNDFHMPILISSLPVIIMIIFGSLSYRNVQRIAYRTVPLVRRELDKQLTVMVLVEVFYDIIAVTPIIIQSVCFVIIGTPNDLNTLIQLNFIKNLTTILYYLHFIVGIKNIKTL